MLTAPFGLLSKNFGGTELTRNAHGYVIKTIPDGIESRMKAQANLQLEIIRTECCEDSAMQVNRWYANAELNALQGGVNDSQHTLGEAVDWVPLARPARMVFEKLARSKTIPFDQAIYYPPRGFIHTSLRSGDRSSGNRGHTLFCPFTKTQLNARKGKRLRSYFDYDEFFALYSADPDKFVKEH